MHEYKAITEDEARQLINADAECLPWRQITTDGMNTVSEWVRKTAKEPDKHNLSEWHSEAQGAANNAAEGEDIIVEMHGFQTATGNPETIKLNRSLFTWIVRSQEA